MPATADTKPTRLATMRQRLVIAGFGMAAHRLLERLVRLGALPRYDVTVIGEEPYPAYDRVRLTEWLEHADTGRLELGGRDWARGIGVRVITGRPAVGIDRNARCVNVAGGQRIPYETLVLATGSSPFVPPIPGVDRADLFVYRAIEDLRAIRRRASCIRDAIVIGGGLLGLEAADALVRLGLNATVLETAPHLMNRQLDASGAALLEARIRALGIRTVCSVRVLRIERQEDGFVVNAERLAGPLRAGMVVVAAGVRPRDELGRSAGLAVGVSPGGIVVNDALRTSDPAICAIGDCAMHDGVVYGLAAPAQGMAEVLAERLAGQSSLFRVQTPSTRLKLLGVEVCALGDHSEPGTSLSWQEGSRYRQLTLRGDRIIGASSVGSWPELGEVQRLVRKAKLLWPWQRVRFQRDGTLGLRSGQSVSSWPDSAVVCTCVGVTKGALLAARSAGCVTAESIQAETRVSTVCGSCRPLVCQLLSGAGAFPAAPGRRALLATAAVVALLGLLVVAAKPPALAESVQAAGLWDALFRDSWWRQATGFSLLGCSLAAGALPLRKRWKRLRLGDFGWWRAVHGGIGALALVTLVAHTGLRLGSGLNQALMVTFLAANVLGSAAAFGSGRPLSKWLLWLHVGAIAPLPVLLAFHILSAYYF